VVPYNTAAKGRPDVRKNNVLARVAQLTKQEVALCARYLKVKGGFPGAIQELATEFVHYSPGDQTRGELVGATLNPGQQRIPESEVCAFRSAGLMGRAGAPDTSEALCVSFLGVL
jgi:hypothetical protein